MTHRKALLSTVVGIVLSFAVTAHAGADVRRGPYRTDKVFGLGLMIGSPSGLTAKYFLGEPIALQFGLGSSHYGHHDHDGRDHGHYRNDGLHLHGDVLWHPVVLLENPTLQLPFYVGVGAQVRSHDDYDDHDGHSHLGARVPFGVALDFNRVPIDVFFELAFALEIIGPDSHSYVTGSLGARYYF